MCDTLQNQRDSFCRRSHPPEIVDLYLCAFGGTVPAHYVQRGSDERSLVVMVLFGSQKFRRSVFVILPMNDRSGPSSMRALEVQIRRDLRGPCRWLFWRAHHFITTLQPRISD